MMDRLEWLKRTLAVSVVVLGLNIAPAIAGDSGGSMAYSREDYETEIHSVVMEASEAYGREDYVTALNLYRPLAEQGNAVAQHNLALMYWSGHGVLQDCKEALKWYRKSAERGYDSAIFALGSMYENGNCEPQDTALAYALYNIASVTNTLAASNRRSVSKQMSSAQLEEGQAISRQLARPGEFLKALDAAAAR